MAIAPGIFALKDARSLYEKLRKDFECLKLNPTDSCVCFNFFVTAEHLPEWFFNADSEKANEFRRKHAALRVCSHIANGAKHFVAKDERHHSVASTATMETYCLTFGGARNTIARNAEEGNEFLVECGPCDSPTLGSWVSVTELARRILELLGGLVASAGD